ncbi:hypothetical protein EVAR_72902_1 [Eumeta japonica]|uniref:Uncharacterized protein n=1 Tax=Eumeta variegata TaxID=151549 RepID=A0A4C1TFH8_EUMVA|nr:hypothetical protein EVAR_72902_1 [Eumeta japonica]
MGLMDLKTRGLDLEIEDVVSTENSVETDVSLMSQYKDKLECIFKNIRYLDTYGRVDESEIRLSFQEAGENSVELQDGVRICAHRTNSKYQAGYLGNSVLELQRCLTNLDTAYAKVFKIRDETSRHY